MTFKDSYDEIFKNVTRVMCVFSHPDDLEIYSGGIVARLIKNGKEVVSVKMTTGNKGSRQEKITEKDLTELRLSEDKKAMKVLGIKNENNVYLNLKDGEIENTLPQIEKLVYTIRKFKPELIITHNPEDKIIRFDDDNSWVNHRDHLNTGLNVLDAAYPYSRDVLFFPEHFKDEAISSHECTKFLLVDYYNNIDTKTFDVTETVAIRTKAISAHSSQYSIDDAQDSTDFFTKLDNSGKRYERFRFVQVD